MKLFNYLTVFSLAFFYAPIYADDLDMQDDASQSIANETSDLPATEDDFFTEIPTALTLSRLEQAPRDAPSASTIIDREMIRAAGIIDLPEIFRLVPGFYVATNAGYIHNTNHVASYHGLANAYAGRMQVLIDGRTVYEPLYGGVQWSELPLVIDDIMRIEITRGPNAATYGANAFLGVINIITKHASETQGSRATFNHGNGRNEAFYRYGGKTENSHYRFNLGYKQDDGLKNRTDFKRTHLFNFQSDYQISESQNIEFQLGYTNGKRGEGDDLPNARVFTPRTKEFYQHFQLVKWSSEISKNNQFYVQGYHAFSQSDDVVDTRPLPPVVPRPTFTKNLVEIRRFDIEAQHTHYFSPQLRMAWGASARQDRLKAPFWLGTHETQDFNLQRLFGQVEYAPNEKVLFNLGSMTEHNDFTGTAHSPRASINFNLSPQQTIRFGISSANRTPSYLEEKFNTGIKIPTAIPGTTFLFQRFANLGNLDEEKIVSREIGYMGQFSNVSIDAKLFADRITDTPYQRTNTQFVFSPPFVKVPGSGNPRTHVNTGEIKLNGFETQIKWQPAEKTNLLLNYARVNISAQSDLDDDYADIGESMPRDTFSMLFTQGFQNDLTASVAGYYTTPVLALGDGNPVNTNVRWDLSLNKRFNLGQNKALISANVQNIFDKHDIEFARYNELRRRAFLSLQLDF